MSAISSCRLSAACRNIVVTPIELIAEPARA